MAALHRQVGGRRERRSTHVRPLLVERPRIKALPEPVTHPVTDGLAFAHAERPDPAARDDAAVPDGDPPAGRDAATDVDADAHSDGAAAHAHTDADEDAIVTA